MIIAGLDPSLKNFGMSKGVLCEDTGTFNLTHLRLQTTDPSKAKMQRKSNDDFNRATALRNAMFDFISDVDLVMAEVPIGSQSARASVSYGISIGLIAAIQKPLIQVNPTEVKLAATGNKTATKAEMISWAIETYPDADWLTEKRKGELRFTHANEHLADSVAVIHAGVKSETFQQLLAFQRKVSP